MPTCHSIPYASLNTPQLLTAHNELARERGVAPLKRWRESYCRLVQRVAILRTRAPIAIKAKPRRAKPVACQHVKRDQPIRDKVLQALAVVAHYEDAASGACVSKRAAPAHGPRLLSVGLPYSEVLALVRRAFPKCRMTGASLRWNATQVRAGMPGFENCKLPDKRPHGIKRNP